MTLEDKKQLDAHVKAIAKILYKNMPPEKVQTFGSPLLLQIPTMGHKLALHEIGMER